MTTELTTDARNELADYVERLESLMAEKKTVAEKIKAEFAEAAGSGFDKRAIQQIIKERAADLDKTIEQRAIVESYRKALGSLSGTPLGDWARQWMANDARHEERAQKPSAMSDWMKSKRAKSSGEEGRAAE